MVIKWKAEAREQLRHIINYYDDLGAIKMASHIIDEIDNSISRLVAFPKIGPKLPEVDEKSFFYCRYIVIAKHYKIIYNIDNDTINILAIWDTRQDPEKLTELL